MRSNFSLAVTGTSRCYTTAVGAEPFKTCYKNAENLCPICTGEFRITVNGGFASSFFLFFFLLLSWHFACFFLRRARRIGQESHGRNPREAYSTRKAWGRNRLGLGQRI